MSEVLQHPWCNQGMLPTVLTFNDQLVAASLANPPPLEVGGRAGEKKFLGAYLGLGVCGGCAWRRSLANPPPLEVGGREKSLWVLV